MEYILENFLDETDIITDAIDDHDQIITKFELKQNYPNPFNPSTIISFSIPKKEFVNLTIYDLLGNMVSVLENGILPAGNYKKNFESNGISSGIYFYVLKAGEYVDSKKMILLK